VVSDVTTFAMSLTVPTSSTESKKFLVAAYGGFKTVNLRTYFWVASIYVIFTVILSLVTVQDWAVIHVIVLWQMK
jgi:hypothetical protein